MGARFSGWFAVCAIVAVLVLGVAAPARADDSYLTDPGEAARAVEKLIEEIGRRPQILSIQIQDREITLRVQGQNRASDIDEWRIGHVKKYFLDFEMTSGPNAYQDPGLVKNVADGFFPLDSLALDRTAAIVAAAIAHAKLEDAATVTSIEIARQISILPQPSFGDVRWTMYLTTGRETASVTTDAQGTIIGADLSNTNRARNMDMLADADWPREQAIADLSAFVGDANRLRDFTVRDTSISMTADHETIKGQTQGYSWNLSGVSRSPFLSPLFPGTGDDGLFSIKDVDLAPLGRIRDAARTAWGNDNARLEYMMLKRTGNGPQGPELRWIVYFNDLGAEGGLMGNSGTVEITPAEEIRVVNLPASRRPKMNWLLPEATFEALARIDTEFRPGTRYAEILVRDDRADILAEDPSQPGTMRSYIIDDRQVSSSGGLMPWDAELRPERMFTMQALAFFTTENLRALKAQTYARLRVTETEMPVARYTFSIGQLMGPDGSFMVPSPDGKVTLEIRVEDEKGWKGGRVTYSSDGKEIDVVTP